MCSFNHDPPLFLPPMVNSESAVVRLLPFHTWLRKTCGRLLPGCCPCLCVHAWPRDEILKCPYHSIINHWVAVSAASVPKFYPSTLLYLGGVASFIYLFFSRSVARGSGRQTSSGPMTELIHRSCRMKRPFGVNPFHKASMESFSRMPVPFAALTVLEYDEKGLERVQWLSYVYKSRE